MTISEQIWQMKYKHSSDNTPEDTFRRVATALMPENPEPYYELMASRKFMPAGRILAGAGTGRRVTLFNCFVMGTLEDSLPGILKAATETATTLQAGGGIGVDFSPLRPKGALVKGLDATASGPVSFMHIWDSICRTIMSAGTRRGAMMAVLRCDHPDIFEFIRAKRDPAHLRMFNLSVGITDGFLHAVLDDEFWDLEFEGKVYSTVKARDLWEDIMQSTYAYAEPGVVFLDTINEANNLRATEYLAATNPCVTGDTRIHTSLGMIRADELWESKAEFQVAIDTRTTTGEKGTTFVRSTPMRKTGVNQDIWEVRLSNGASIKATDWHKFYTKRGKLPLKDLVVGDSVLLQSGIGAFGTSGSYDDGLAMSQMTRRDRRVPDSIFKSSEACVEGYIWGLTMGGEGYQVPSHIKSAYPQFLEDVQILLSNLGFYSTIKPRQVAPGGYYVLSIEDELLEYTAKIVSIKLWGKEDVYDVTSESHSLIFNGIVTGNCGEQPLPPYGACLLGSLNLTKFVVDPFSPKAEVDWTALHEATFRAVELLDKVIDESNYPLPQQEAEAKAKRRMGLGLTGLGSTLAMLGIKYSSEKGRDQAARIMSCITDAAYYQSAQLAEERGAFPGFCLGEYRGSPIWDKLSSLTQNAIVSYGLRNSHLTSIAPTGTISLFMGNVSSGLEPIFATEYTRHVTQPDGTKTQEVVQDYAVAEFNRIVGVHMPLTDYFETALNISPKDHVLMQAALQPYVDSAISKTINVPVDCPYEDFKRIYEDAWLKGLKGCTTYRPNDITGAVLEVAPKEKEAPAPAVVTHELAVRPDKVLGATYKLTWQGRPHAYYVTINSTEDGAPIELFINTKDPDSYSWIAGLTRMISAIFRRGGDVSFVAQELREVFDPAGGMWQDGEYVPSFLALVGRVLEEHLGVKPGAITSGRKCPQCGEHTLQMQNGCDTCQSCGYSKCG